MNGERASAMARTGSSLSDAWRRVPPLPRELALAFVIACLYFPCVLDYKIISPTFIDWMFGLGSDRPGYYLSLAYYRNSEWFFPITRFDTLLHPVGTSVVMTDSIPILAVPTKLLSRFLPRDFQYYGAWLFSCVWLLAFFARRTLGLFVQSHAVHWLGTLLITASLPMAAALVHIGLSAHWLLIAALYVVLAPRSRFPTAAICAVVLIAEWTHPYLFVMASGLLLAALWVHRKLPGAPLGFAAFCVLPILAAWPLGYFHVSESHGWGYEHYISDISTLFNPMEASTFLPAIPVGKGSYEGFAYLGLGGLALVLALGITVLRRGARAHPAAIPLAVLCVGMALYAFTAKPQFAGEVLFQLSSVSELLSSVGRTFRASGRFIWPLYYVLLIAGAVALDRLVASARLRVALAAAVLAVQVVDVGPWLWTFGQHPALTAAVEFPPLPAEVTEQLSSASEILILLPPGITGGCPRWRPRTWKGPWHHLALFGARHRLKTNSDFAASARLGNAARREICNFTMRMRRSRRRHPEAIFAAP